MVVTGIQKIEEPLPLLPRNHKNQHLIGNLPKFSYIDGDYPEPLGEIKGKPQKEVVVNERDLL